jgi:hypothetical protein
MYLKKLNQRAAMFGMDARIALLAMGVAALAIGVSSLTQINEAKVFLAEKRMNDYKKSIFSAWVSESPYGYTPSPTDTYSTFASEYGDKTLGQDPWGNNYIFNRVSAAKTIDGQSVTIYFYTLYSTGPDETNNTVTITTEAQYISWAPAGDDIGIKFSTYDITRKALADAQQRLNEITTRLKIYERQIFETVRTYCDVLANQLTATCDFNGNGTYITDEEFKMNFFPRATGENTATKYYNSGTTYTSGNATGMANLLTLIGLPTPYFYDKLQRQLRYTSNATGATEAPFAARVWYQ